MPRVIIDRSNGRIGEMQSSAKAGTLLKNITDNGGRAEDFEERVVTMEGYQSLLANDPSRVSEREIETEAALISGKAKQVAAGRDRKEAVRLLKLDGKTFSHHDNNGKRV